MGVNTYLPKSGIEVPTNLTVDNFLSFWKAASPMLAIAPLKSTVVKFKQLLKAYFAIARFEAKVVTLVSLENTKAESLMLVRPPGSSIDFKFFA